MNWEAPPPVEAQPQTKTQECVANAEPYHTEGGKAAQTVSWAG